MIYTTEYIEALISDHERAELLSWRIENLMRAGFPEWLAAILAINDDVDHAAAGKMVKDGGDPMTVAGIVL